MKKSEVAKILLEKYFGSDRELKSKPDREALMKQVQQYINSGQLSQNFGNEWSAGEINKKQIVSAVNKETKLTGDDAQFRQSKKQTQQEEEKQPVQREQQNIETTTFPSSVVDEPKKRGRPKRNKSNEPANINQKIQSSLDEEHKEQVMQKLGNIEQTQKQIYQIVTQATKTPEGQSFFKLPTVRADNPKLASQVLSNKEFSHDEESFKSLEKSIGKVEKSKDPNAVSRAEKFKDKISQIAHSSYISDSDYNSSTSGIPQIQQRISQPRANGKSANATIAVNGSGFAGQKIPEQPREIYNAVTGHVDVSQYKDEKERFAKEVYYKTRNLHPEVRKRAEAVMQKLETLHAHKILGSQKLQKIKELEQKETLSKQEQIDLPRLKREVQGHESQMNSEQIMQLESKRDEIDQQLQKMRENKKNLTSQQIKEYDELTLRLKEIKADLLNARIEPLNPHVAAKERKEVVYPVFSLTEKEVKYRQRAGEVETFAIKNQNQAMVSRFQKGLNDNPDAHTQNQMAQRDAGETYNTSIKPDYKDILPELHMIVEQLAQQEHADPEQLQQALAVLDSQDPFEVLFNLNFLNSKVAEIPITTKEQQRIRNESEAIARKVGRDQVFYPYNKREIELLQGSLSRYTDAGGNVVPQPVRSKQYYEGLQQAEQKGVRKELQHLHGVKKEETLKYLRNKQLELEGARGKEKTKLSKEIIELQKQLKQMPDIQEEGEPAHGEVGIQQFVEFAHKLIQYVSKIDGDIDPTNTNLANYKTKTTVFTPTIKKKENAQFQFTAQSAFKLRPC